MKKLMLVSALAILAGCAAQPQNRADQARYGTAPSEEDLYQYMAQLRDSMPPARYVSYRDSGYAKAVKPGTAIDSDGQQIAGWEYDFEATSYDAIDGKARNWTGYRALFFNGRAIGIIDAQGRLQRVPANSALGDNARTLSN